MRNPQGMRHRLRSLSVFQKSSLPRSTAIFNADDMSFAPLNTDKVVDMEIYGLYESASVKVIAHLVPSIFRSTRLKFHSQMPG
jgi:hypothetical protein